MKFIGVFVFSLFMTAESAAAYIDPGTGSQIIQVVLAAGFGILFFAKDIVSKVKSIFSKKETTVKEKKDE